MVELKDLTNGNGKAASDGVDEEASFVNGGNGSSNGNSGNWRSENNEEEERDSLLRETADTTNTVLGMLRSAIGARFLCYGVAVIGIVAALAILFGSLDEAFDGDPTEVPPHQPSLGGGLNLGHNTNGTSNMNQAEKTEEFPLSNVGVAVVSNTEKNRLNVAGHFWHDPHKSPYASPFYKQSQSSQYKNGQQKRFDDKIAQVMKDFGYYSHSTAHFEDLRRPIFASDPYRDMPTLDFPLDSWQTNTDYLTLWLEQAQALVGRVKEGIYREYGYDTSKLNMTRSEIQHMKKERDQQFQVLVGESPSSFNLVNGAAHDKNDLSKRLPGVAHLTPAAWNGLVRKLLHACMTMDEFNAVAVGPASGTFRPNNFAESHIMQFNDIMEPVFDRLGVRLISRNMGMDASTTVSALGGADIYGEADILWVLPPAPEFENAHNNFKLLESPGQFDLLHRQAILSGERMPIILTPRPARLSTDTGGKAWIGNIQAGTTVCPESKFQKGAGAVFPKVEACHGLRCVDKAESYGVCHRYHSKCWVERTDWNPGPDDTQQDDNAGFQDKGYPGYPQHRWEGRKLAMLVLQALEAALDLWKTKTEQGAVPLPQESWHVGDVYEELRESVRTLVRQPGQASDVPYCEELLKDIDPMICHMSMHAYTEWTPRVTPYFNRMKNITDEPLPDPRDAWSDLYDNVALRPVEWQLPSDAVDVHMIAIAINATVNEGKTWGDYIAPEKQKGDDEVCSDPSCDEWRDVDGSYFHDFGIEYEGGRRQRRRQGRTRQRNLESSSPLGLLQPPTSAEEYHGGHRHRHRRRTGVQFAPTAKSKWTVWKAPIGFCDGSAQSRCHQAIGNKCLLANYNAYNDAGIMGRGDSGWLSMKLQHFKEGVILVRFDHVITPPDKLPSDFVFSYKINSATFSMGRKEFLEKGVKLADDLVVHALMIPSEMSHNGLESPEEDVTVTVALRVRSVSKPKEAELLLTHIYYA